MTNLKKFITPENILIAYIVFAFIGIQPFSIGVNEELTEHSDTSFFRRITYLLFLFFSFIAFDSNREKVSSVVRNFYIYWVFCALIVCSVFWSIYPLLTFTRSMLFLISVTTLIFLISSVEVEIFFKKLSFCFAFLLILSFLSIFLIPSSKHSVGELSGMWRGIFSHKNDAGAAMVFSIFFFIYSFWLQRSFRWLVLIVLALIFLYFSGSKTSLGFLFFSVILSLSYLYVSRVKTIAYLYLFSLIVLVVFLLSIFFVRGFSYESVLDYFFYNPDAFTGRGMIWGYLTDMFLERPLLGYGFGTIWGVGENAILNDFSDYNTPTWLLSLSQGHNSYLDISISLGLVGLFAFFALFIFPHLFLISSNANLDSRFIFLFYGIWSFLLLHGLMETNFLLVDKGRSIIFLVLVLLKTRLVASKRY